MHHDAGDQHAAAMPGQAGAAAWPAARSAQKTLDPPNARQFRITVRVLGPKDTETWVQSLVTKG